MDLQYKKVQVELNQQKPHPDNFDELIHYCIIVFLLNYSFVCNAVWQLNLLLTTVT